MVDFCESYFGNVLPELLELFHTQEEEIAVIKRRNRMYDTKKMGCPAKVHIKRILRLPGFKASMICDID